MERKIDTNRFNGDILIASAHGKKVLPQNPNSLVLLFSYTLLLSPHRTAHHIPHRTQHTKKIKDDF